MPVVHFALICGRPLKLHEPADVVQQTANVGLRRDGFQGLFAKHPGKQRGLQRVDQQEALGLGMRNENSSYSQSQHEPSSLLRTES